ncbi:MAG: response regulator transcription factor [Candidatus Paceibacterota bacterium]|jgi:DNA-binding response OmpR family regulator|nr:response regulator transcription factor [Candidatus Paceibacterota bacterium]
MRILIVEDEETLAQSIKEYLEKQGYAADYVLDGDIAERRIRVSQKDYDLVVLDLMLPKKSGYEICKSVRGAKIDIPIIVLTGKDSMEDKTMLLDSGADDYLTKPFHMEELVSRIRALLRRPKEVLPSEITIRDLTLNMTTHAVTRGGKVTAPLTLKEINLLEYLMRNPNQVLSRSQITNHVWDFSFDSFSNVVDVHIMNIRKKIGDPKGKLLETVRGIGYRIRS